MSLFARIGSLITLFLGLLGLFSPHSTSEMVGILIPNDDGRAISEVRATYGGLFIGLSCYALLRNERLIYRTVGWGWLGAGLARIISMLVLDGVKSWKELIIGLLLIV